jgi:hypothetical protein
MSMGYGQLLSKVTEFRRVGIIIPKESKNTRVFKLS